MNPDGTNAEIIGSNYRNSYEQSVTSLGDVFQNDNDDPPACRVSWVMEYANFGFSSNDGQRTWQADRRPGQSIPVAEWRQEDPGMMPAGDVYGGGSPTGNVFYENGALGPSWEGTFLAAEAGRNEVLDMLDLESQVRLEELPWVAAIDPWVGSDDESRRSARAAMVRATRLSLESFPQTILPNKLVRELRALASAAGEQIPLVDELAADIFMDAFAASYLRAAQAAAPILAGSLYEHYYALPLDRVLALDDVEKTPFGAPSSPGFAALCSELARAAEVGDWSVARNGTIVEQSQILTTHNLAQLVTGLDLLDELRPLFPELARRCFEWICRRQQLVMDDWYAEMQTVKNSGYAWRQMIFYLSMAHESELPRFLDWADEHLAKQREGFRDRFAPAMAGLHAVAAGRRFDGDGFDPASGGRRFLGWTLERHWMLPKNRAAKRRGGWLLSKLPGLDSNQQPSG